MAGKNEIKANKEYIDYPKDRDLLTYNLALVLCDPKRIRNVAIAQLCIFEGKNLQTNTLRLRQIINQIKRENRKIFNVAAARCIERKLLTVKRVNEDKKKINERWK